MPAIVAHCPGCKAKYSLKDPKLVGKKIKCRKCGTTFQITASPAPVEVEEEFAVTEDPYAEFGNYDDDEFGEIRQLPQRRKRSAKKKQAPEQPTEEETSKKVKPARNPVVVFSLIGVGILVVALIGVGAIFVPGIVKNLTTGSELKAPDKFVQFSNEESPLQFDYPEGWEVNFGGGQRGAPPWARIEHGGIKISIRGPNVIDMVNQAGGQTGAIGDMGDGPPRPETEAVHGLHLDRRDKLEKDDPEYSEGPPEVIYTGFGSSRISEFRDSGIFSTSYGYRVTMPPYTTTCSCSQKEFDALKGTFRKIIESIGPYFDDE